MTSDEAIRGAIAAFAARRHEFEHFKRTVNDFFMLEPALNALPLPVVHSIKARVKDPSHLADKLNRKSTADTPISAGNLFAHVTDLAGVRVLHLHQSQFGDIHAAIMRKVNSGDWALAEKPKAYSWDPESRQYFESFELEVAIKESYYTSIHYVAKPRADSDICCEIQVRTLFEEIWGEIDHAINYPAASNNRSCRSQLRVLAKLVSTGSRLADSIFESHREAEKPAHS